MEMLKNLLSRKTKLAVVGLGYVGLPLAVHFGENFEVVGFDNNQKKIQAYKNGKDATLELGDSVIKKASILFSSDPKDLDNVSFFVVAVPTPVNQDTLPDLSPVVGASETVGKHLHKGSIVVYESTVYPGVTEEVCVPILEKQSGLICGRDFKVGYSPERINPGDKTHTLETVVKIVSGQDQDSLEDIADVYSTVVKAGVYKASSIKVAEAAKVIENSQRDINIAFMNELSFIFAKLGISTNEVLKAASTKWNFLPFKPGLVGGHCIGVDPYYLTYCAQNHGYTSKVILSGRQVNDSVGFYIAEEVAKRLFSLHLGKKELRVGVFGLTFKENCPDVRNSRVYDIIKGLSSYGIKCVVYDPVADKDDAKRLYGLDLASKDDMKDFDCLVFAVSHDCFKPMISNLSALYSKDLPSKLLFDVKGMFDKQKLEESGYTYWSL